MTRLILVGGVLGVASGVAVILPAVAESLAHGFLAGLSRMAVLLGGMVIVCGGAAMWIARRHPPSSSMPAPVRATTVATILFVAFCVLEFSDGLLRQQERIFYWTSVLFCRALLLLYGLVAAHRWAWWITRIAAALAMLGFVLFMWGSSLLRTCEQGGIPAPWWARLYMETVTLVFAGISFCVFHSLGRAEAKRYFAEHT
jgi:hypothetical protein